MPDPADVTANDFEDLDALQAELEGPMPSGLEQAQRHVDLLIKVKALREFRLMRIALEEVRDSIQSMRSSLHIPPPRNAAPGRTTP